MKKIMSVLLVLVIMLLFSGKILFADMESAAALRISGDFKGALVESQNVLKASPNDVQAQRMIAQCQVGLEQNNEALASFVDIIANPSAGMYKVEAQWYRGDILMKQGKLDEALVAFDNTITLGNKFLKINSVGQVQMWMGNALISSGDILTIQDKPELAQAKYLQVYAKGTSIAILRIVFGNGEILPSKLDVSVIGVDKYVAYLTKLLGIVTVSKDESVSTDPDVMKSVADRMNFAADVKFEINKNK